MRVTQNHFEWLRIDTLIELNKRFLSSTRS